MSDNTSEYININTDQDLAYLIRKIGDGPIFAEAFKFEPACLRDQLLTALGIQIDEFEQKYFFYDAESNFHISESEHGYLWISTMGLVAKGKLTNNQYVNACEFQYVALSLLLNKAIDLCDDETIYDIDSYSYGYLSKITPTLFNNILFYFETFGKAYLAISNVSIPKTHKLSVIFSQVRQTMFNLHQNDTRFHAQILCTFEQLVKYIGTIPGNFKEQFVKYDDNSGDHTVINFRHNELNKIKNSIDFSYDFIMSYYYDKENVMYLKQGFFIRLLDMAKNDEEKQRITETYGYLKECQ
ncbi:MAG: hypothetical protein PHT62_05820 [Desulfotomaculaceae bacterium]|nr:hypothetical protein [Desulfotomaculaceae bacterium]